jgi:hypothetical protein
VKASEAEGASTPKASSPEAEVTPTPVVKTSTIDPTPIPTVKAPEGVDAPKLALASRPEPNHWVPLKKFLPADIDKAVEDIITHYRKIEAEIRDILNNFGFKELGAFRFEETIKYLRSLMVEE